MRLDLNFNSDLTAGKRILVLDFSEKKILWNVALPPDDISWASDASDFIAATFPQYKLVKFSCTRIDKDNYEVKALFERPKTEA